MSERSFLGHYAEGLIFAHSLGNETVLGSHYLTTRELMPPTKKTREASEARFHPTTVMHPPPKRMASTLKIAENAVLHYEPNTMKCTKLQFEAAWEAQPPQVPNPRNPNTFLGRRQLTYGAEEYGFGQQISPGLPMESAPEVVQLCLADAQRRAGASAAGLYTAAHVNWYKDGKTGLAAHQDTDASSLAGHHIYSYTFISAPDDDDDYRHFVVSRDRQQKDIVACVATRHGDLVVMSGSAFQRNFWHGVPKTSRKKMANVRRINVTVRAWGGATAVRDHA
jgi:alkylated DNA repair dioxygenase AlkB